MHQLGLAGMARAFAELEANPQSADLAHAEWLGLLLDREVTERYERRLRARLRYARLRHQAAVEDVDYRAARGLDRALFQAMIAGRWIDEAQNLIVEGPAGVGKSWLACALGQKACRDNRSVLYQRVPGMFSDLALARRDGRYPRLMRGWGCMAPVRQSPRWREMDSNHRYRIRNNPFWLPPFGSAIRLPQQKPTLSCRGPIVRIHLPPGKSLRTIGS